MCLEPFDPTAGPQVRHHFPGARFVMPFFYNASRNARHPAVTVTRKGLFDVVQIGPYTGNARDAETLEEVVVEMRFLSLKDSAKTYLRDQKRLLKEWIFK